MGSRTAFSAALVAMVLAFSGPVAAAVITIDFAGDGGLQSGDSMVFSAGGVDVTATAGATAVGLAKNVNSRIGQYSAGLGNTTSFDVCIGRFCHPVGDSTHEVDDHLDGLLGGAQEFIRIDFHGLEVTLLGIEFGYHDLLDTSAVEVVESGELVYWGYESKVEASDVAAHSASVFDFIAADFGVPNNDWKLRSITFQHTSVPEPATFWLLGAALSGLAISRRRRRRDRAFS